MDESITKLAFAEAGFPLEKVRGILSLED